MRPAFAALSEPPGSVARMHDTDPATPTVADLEAHWEAARAAVTAHAALGRRNDARPPEDDPQRQASDDAHEAWVAEWDRLQDAARVAVVALHRVRQDSAE